ncbi:NAD(P)H-hydrate dehydratase [Halobacteria archaeon AArc-curdl1]|uniref:Bifunctional NAD(P)H-hydrate repair enzyme n=1 Tax=Natronosalvus hydrolyticus TaxID=2979988 RepID=A0AAP2ZAE5_9EURY|nr:NAD(P)H-hydrate dehydratase [Halobacteria archaeon AArc-curdl1]
MITGRRMAAVDQNAAALGVTQKQLMESSGHAVARAVERLLEDEGGSHLEDDSSDPDARDSSDPPRVCIVAGRGNNGGDAFVAARFLEAYDVTTVLVGRADAIGTQIARENWAALEAAEHDLREIRDSRDVSLPACDLVVDAMLGTGITGDLREPAASMAAEINAVDAPVLSVDVPSGFDADGGDHATNGVEADHVVTFHDTKPGLEALSASLEVVDIGIPAAAGRFVGPGDCRLARPEARTGRAFVVGGGPYTGAPALAALAALRTGMELSFVAAPSAVAGEIASYSQDLIVQPYDGDVLTPEEVPDLVETAERYDDVVTLGPGLGTADATLEAVGTFLEDYTGPAVVDADALAVVPDLETDATLVCTPNTRELERMGGPATDEPQAVADEIEAFARDLGHVVLVKGATDVITDGETTRLNRSGTPAMAVGGTGDLLAGITAGLLEHTDALEAAAVGAYVNGRAGESVAADTHVGLLATDLLEAIPPALWGGDDE